MILSEVDFNFESFMTPILDTGVMLIFIVLMIYLYMKIRIFPLILITMLISLIVGVVSIELSYNPFTPWFQLFFICFQVVFFLKTAILYNNKRTR